MQEQITFIQFAMRLKKILWDDKFDNVELIGIANCVIWATWFLTHPQLFAISKIYTTLGLLGNEYVWAAGFFFMAAIKLYGIYIDKYYVRKWIAFFVTLIWIFVLSTFIQENSTALLVAITGEIVVISTWEFLRHARHQEDREIAKEIVKQEIENL